MEHDRVFSRGGGNWGTLSIPSSTAQGGGGSFKNRKRIGDWLL